MGTHRLRRSALFLMGCLCTCFGCSSGGTRWLASSDSAAFEQMVADAARARVVFVGEIHDQREHHNLQLQLIKALAGKGVRLAIGLEMFDMESQAVLDRWVKGDMALKEFVASYRQNWSISWAEYDSILLYARNNRIPLIALDPPGEIVSKIARGGFNSLSSADRARLPRDVTPSTSPSYRNFIYDVFAGHGREEASFSSFCEAQGTRNSAMGHRIRTFVKENDGTMVVITGIGHAMRRAVADGLEKESGIKCVVVMPVVEGLFNQVTPEDADFLVYP